MKPASAADMSSSSLQSASIGAYSRAGGLEMADHSSNSYTNSSLYTLTTVADNHPILPTPVIEDLSSFMTTAGPSESLYTMNSEEEEDDVDYIFGPNYRSDSSEDDDSWEASLRNPYEHDVSMATATSTTTVTLSPKSKKREWLLRMTRKMQEIPVGELDPTTVPLAAVMNAWAKTKSSQGASMVEAWLKRAEQEQAAGNDAVVPTTKMYTMAGM